MTTELKVLRPDDFDTWFETPRVAFGGTATDAWAENWRSLIDHDRMLGGWDGEEAVSTAGAFAFRMAVPGGAVVPTAGVTMVTVKATHRRQGILTAMMRRQLDDVRALGEPLAVLWPSEPDIYGRFGYAAATQQTQATLRTHRLRLDVPAGADTLRLRLVKPGEDEVLRRCEELYARTVPGRPGMLARQPGWDRAEIFDPADQRHGSSPLLCVLAETAEGELRGYARYVVKPQWAAGGPESQVELRDLAHLDPAAYGALLRYLCGIDLADRLVLPGRPVDDPWLLMASDPRRGEPLLRDGLQLRLVDLPAALEARTYAAPVDVVFEVADDFCPWNAGRWRLTGDAKGATCVRTDASAELELSVRELAAVYLGGYALTSLAGAGRVREVRPGALAETSLAFGSEVTPWCPHGF